MNEKLTVTTTSPTPVRAFYCCDPADWALCQALDLHLAPLKQAGRIQTWDEQQILAGAERARERDRQFSLARLLLLLLSPDLLASETGQQQIRMALHRHQTGDAVVIPLLLRPCAWKETELRSLQILPADHEALMLQPNRDKAWQEVVAEISRVLDALQKRVFVISAPEDQDIAERLSQDMLSSGVALWHFKRESLSPHLHLPEAAQEAIRQASCVVLVASPAALSSQRVKVQLELARDYQRPLFVFWAKGEDKGQFTSGAWRAEVVLDVRTEGYETARTLLLSSICQSRATTPVIEKQCLPLAQPRNPYKGLHTFTAQDTHDFFGREALVDELTATLKDLLVQEQKGKQNGRLLAILGASGSGKSSVVLAGLLPRLKLGGAFDSQEWIYLDPIIPGTYPIEALAVSLAQQPTLEDVVSLHTALTSDSQRTLHLLIRQLVGSSARKVVLFIDQFEEVFTLTTAEDERKHFFDLLTTAVTEPQGPLLVILTLRMDFSERAVQYPDLYRLMDAAHRVSVLPMERDDLRRVIKEPARLADVQITFEDDLVGDLLFEMREQVGTLPLLEFTLDQLFMHRSGQMLTLQAYSEIGGVKGALTKHAEATYNTLPTKEHQALARNLFLRLIDPGHNEQDTTRRRVHLSEFERYDSAQTKLQCETMDAFVAARLLTTNERAGEATLEVSHEALIREWPRLAEWLGAAREDILLQQKISEDAAQWLQRRRSNDRLYRGSQLKEARAWARSNPLSQTEAAFLKASAKQRRFTIVSIQVLALFLLSSLGGAVWYIHFLQPDPTLVTTQQDGGVGSLRWAVLSAPSGSTITFASNLTGQTLVLTGDLVIPGPKNLTLEYSWPRKLCISLAKNTLLVDARASLTLLNLSLLGGLSNSESILTNHGTLTLTDSTVSGNTNSARETGGGGIYNDSTMMLTNSTIFGNTSSGGAGGGIANFGRMTLTNSTISRNTSSGGGAGGAGGGIANFGRMTLTNSTISGNTVSGDGSANYGGGIDNFGTMTLTNSTISGNTLSGGGGEGGGIFNNGRMTLTNSTISENKASGNISPGNGGGIGNNDGGTMTLTNSTISRNTASHDGGGVLNFGSTVRFTFCTLYGNQAAAGSGLTTQDETFDSPPVVGHSTIQNSLIAGNSAATYPDVAGNLTSEGYNLIQNGSGLHLQSTDRTDISLLALKIDPTLQLNGSQTTKTHALLPGSPAIDVIPLAACHPTVNGVLITTDQRGIKRPQEAACDIGAYEYAP